MYNDKNMWIDEECKFVFKNSEGNDIEIKAIRKESGVWIENGTMLVEPTTQWIVNNQTIPLETLRQLKIDELDQACNCEINSGFIFQDRLFGFDQKDDQLNLEALKNNVALGLIPDGSLEYYAKSQPCEHFNNATFMALYGTAMEFKTERIHTCKAKKEQARIATEEELGLIKWVPLKNS
jgi:hypothetical protein